MKPKSNGNGGGNFENRNFPVPKAGVRRARLSLIVDLGTQERKPVYQGPDGKLCKEDTPGAVRKDQKPARQIAMFADLVNDVVDYGGDIGEAQYRLMLNKSFKGEIEGINFYHCPPLDGKGKWGYHAQSMVMKIADAMGKEGFGIQDVSDDVSELLGEQFFAEVEVKETNSGKQDKDGNDIIYKNVNFRKPSPVAPEIKEDADGNEIEVVPTFAKLRVTPMCISFDEATKEQVKFLRRDILKKIKASSDYEGSQMQKAIEEYEAENGGAQDEPEKPAAKPAKPAPKKPATPKKPVVQDDDDPDDDLPF